MVKHVSLSNPCGNSLSEDTEGATVETWDAINNLIHTHE